MDTDKKILDLRIEIQQHEYWLTDGGMCNPMKIKRRKKRLEKAKEELAELLKEK